jgi:hypothetical protein
VLDYPARDRTSASNRPALVELDAQLAVGGVDRQCRRVSTRQQEDHAAHRYHFLEHIRDRREQRLAVEMTSDGAMNFEECRKLIGGEPQVQHRLRSWLNPVRGLLDSASVRSDRLTRVSARVLREITTHAACTCPWALGNRRGCRDSCGEVVVTPRIPRDRAGVNSPPPNHSPQPEDQSARYGGPYSWMPLFVAGRLRPHCLELADDPMANSRDFASGTISGHPAPDD